MKAAKLGIALGGGAARGWAHIGVLKTLLKAGVEPNIVVGTSIGAVAGGCFVADQLDELEAFARSLTRSRVLSMLDFNLAGSGLINGQRLQRRMERHIGDRIIDDLDKRFVAIATELNGGHEIWLNRGRLSDAMRASYALPGIFHPVRIGGRWLVDGALVNPVPVSVARAMGAQAVIAVNLHGDTFGKGTIVPDFAADGIEEEPEPNVSRRGANRWTAALLIHRQLLGRNPSAPGISSVMMDAFGIVQDRVARSRLAADPPDLTIKPQLGHVGLFDFHRADELIAIGAEAAERELDRILTHVDAAEPQPVAI